MEEISFQAWPKIPRLRNMVITEKIDGTNAAVGVAPLESYAGELPVKDATVAWTPDESGYLVWAQSRTRLITPDEDNYGFARWVYENANQLAELLGEGLHFGEWWGQGIQRRYGMDEKRFSLFNTKRWGWMQDPEARAAASVHPQLDVVPQLTVNSIDTNVIEETLAKLMANGSVAAPGYPSPEGVVVYLPDAGAMFKKTERDVAKGAMTPVA